MTLSTLLVRPDVSHLQTLVYSQYIFPTRQVFHDSDSAMLAAVKRLLLYCSY